MMLRFVALLLVAPFLQAQPVSLDSDEAFENAVHQDGSCWAVLFTSKTREDKCAPVIRGFSELGARYPGVKYGVADVDDVKAVSSEFNVRKRMVPRILLFKTRARQADVISGDVGLNGAILADVLKGEFADNTWTDGVCQKITLALGGASDEL
eukprot:CAMPEP_0183352578 /NCGR_PEP_ID=MMETSP0164_2-20130417/29529_1 /TAXON_ID=221442 /ORGANISM="Coccolithus pelagicus ssp braarudi, Strain PLY182g" /LENGTH=152 /DNA_ID=CAMNT_0025525045 /DNA_START=10 /DNA_END=468 /DNA_ORIENTATION=+